MLPPTKKGRSQLQHGSRELVLGVSLLGIRRRFRPRLPKNPNAQGVATSGRLMWRWFAGLLVFGVLAGCREEPDNAAEKVVRGLRAYKISASTESPTVLQPADISRLSFE